VKVFGAGVVLGLVVGTMLTWLTREDSSELDWYK